MDQKCVTNIRSRAAWPVYLLYNSVLVIAT